MKKLILTAFEPFGGSETNPSMSILKNIPDMIGDIKIVKMVLPVVYNKCFDSLKYTIIKEQPDFVICMGLAGGRPHISVERIAVNMQSASIADNEGNDYKGKVIRRNGQVGYFTTLPFEKLKEVDEKVAYSFSAGTFTCNNIFYLLMEFLENSDCKGGLIHVPYSEHFRRRPYLSISEQSEIIRKMISQLGV